MLGLTTRQLPKAKVSEKRCFLHNRNVLRAFSTSYAGVGPGVCVTRSNGI